MFTCLFPVFGPSREPLHLHTCHCVCVCVFHVWPTGFFLCLTWCSRRFDYDGSAVAGHEECRNHRTTIIWYYSTCPKYGRMYKRVRVYLRKNQAPPTWPWLLPTLTDNVPLMTLALFSKQELQNTCLCTIGVERCPDKNIYLI